MRVDLEKLEALLNAAKFELTFGDENDAYAELNIGDSGCRLSMRREGTYPGESGMSRAQMLAFMHLVQESINALPSLITELRETRAALEQAIDLAQIKLVDGIVVFGEHSLSRVECDCPELAKALVVEE